MNAFPIRIIPRNQDKSTSRSVANKLTLVECRIHKTAQDVNWIEELIGRRLSLRAHLVIAVSASGFTQGAQAKAARFGVVLRDFDTLTADEVRDWGKKRKVRAIFYKFTDNVISVTLPLLLPRRPTMSDPQGNSFNWRPLFAQVMQQLDERKSIPYGATTAMPVFLPDVKTECSFGGMKAIRTTFSSTVRRVVREIWTTSVVAYADPLDGRSRQALFGALDLGKSEILEACGRASIVIDVSQIKIPKSCLFKAIILDLGRPVGIGEMRLVGAPDALKWQNEVKFQFLAP